MWQAASATLDAPVVFSHNDLLSGNFMVDDQSGERGWGLCVNGTFHRRSLGCGKNGRGRCGNAETCGIIHPIFFCCFACLLENIYKYIQM